ncbi:ATP-binding protein [Streptomyces sp. NPDC005805]|uniref:ATP-binding protein n=1 Tax=Streptomyces sp. NPDC005805 TaxID=3157068 RepID=UPI0033F7C7F4
MTVSATARPTGHPGYSETLPCTAESAESARRLVRAALVAWGMKPVADDGALIVTELVANAVRHTEARHIRVVVERTSDERVRVGVADKSRVAPQLRHASDSDVHGRGLTLVDALATRWWTDLRPWGKCVWAELRAGNGRR